MKKIINAGIVGLGRISAVHASEIASYPELFKWVACADNAPDRLENAHAALKDCAKYDSLDEMLKHPDLDMVTIATRHPDHVPMAIKILEAGNRTAAGPTVPPGGLYMTHLWYDVGVEKFECPDSL